MSEEIDSRKSSRESFLSHLEKSADKVRTWPEWKKKSLYAIKCKNRPEGRSKISIYTLADEANNI